MRISIISDSMTLGRIDYDRKKIEADVIINHFECWPNLLSQKYSIYNNAARERTTNYLATKESIYESIQLVDPSLIIIQIGVVDCAPRIFTLSEKIFLSNRYFPQVIRSYIINKRKLVRNNINKKGTLRKVYVKPNDFYHNAKLFLDQCKHKVVFIVPIICFPSKIDVISFGFSKNAELYNKLFSKAASLYENVYYLESVLSLINDETNFCNDYYHLSVLGHKNMANIIDDKIRKINIL